jgi:hypothetical protein|tara:strand:- start:708 stop:911 length:204 start_codon:yes stop_codon:yes gene_type:complete
MGPFHPQFWDLFQIDVRQELGMMSTNILLLIAVLVFCLVLTGLFLTMQEFQKGDDPSVQRVRELNSG